MRHYSLNDLKAIARQVMTGYGFAPQFSSDVLREAQSIQPFQYSLQNNSKITDRRDLLWSSIDNVDSRDLDQLEYCERRPNGEIHVKVAIADVDHYVKKATSTDRYAHHNATSIYTGVEIFPMLPQRLSTDLSSLVAGEDRLAVVIEFSIQKDGNLIPGDIYRAVVRNKAKLVYESVGDWLEGKAPIPPAVQSIESLKEQLMLQDEAAERLHAFRMQKGTLEFETIEAAPVVKDGDIFDLVIKHKDRARFLIENFMIAANQTMVHFLEQNGFCYIQRVVREPERWMKIREVAQERGETLPPEPDSLALSEFLSKERSRDELRFPDLSLMIVKLLGPGEYVMVQSAKEKTGHFGLAVYDYTHSTAPNRRYVDVIIQRLVKAALAKTTCPYNKEELGMMAQHCSERDQSAKKVERFMRKAIGAVLLAGRIGEIFEGIVTGVSEKGTYVRLLHPPVEGRVMRGEAGMDVGEKVRVRLVDMLPEKGYIDFENADREVFDNHWKSENNETSRRRK